MPAPRAAGRSGVTGIHIWLIVFVALWLTSTVLLVLLYTEQEELKAARANLRTDNAKLIADPEKRSLSSFYGAARETGPTMVGLLERERSKTAQLITTGEGVNESAALAAAVNASIDSAGDLLERIDKEQAVEGSDGDGASLASSFVKGGLLDALQSLTAILEGQATRLKEADAQKRELNAKIATLGDDNQKQREDFAEKVAKLSEQFTAAEQEHRSFREKKDEEVAGFTAKLDQIDKAKTNDIQKIRATADAAKQSLAEYKERYFALQAKIGEANVGPRALATARRSDGRVVTAKPGDDIVYIDLGSGMHVVPGMVFAVYSGDGPIPPDGRAKARIQLQRIFERTSEAKVVELLRNSVVLEGDQIANPIYDRARPVKFKIMGEFDLNGDGQADPSAPATFEAMILAWGGEVVSDLAPDIDFIVLGVAPRRPASVGNVTAEQKERDAKAKELYEKYEADLDKAQNLAIPLLLQDTFLNFLGYGYVLPRALP